MFKAVNKKKAILLVGFHYFSTPLYNALKKQLKKYELVYLFTKDPGVETNYTHFDRSELKRCDSNYVELNYDPPWCRPDGSWQLRTKSKKILLWGKWFFSFFRFKKELESLIDHINPDLIITTSDMFFTPRYIAAKKPYLPVALILPSYFKGDFMAKKLKYSISKRIVNIFQPLLFPRQPYIGLEIETAALLVWEPLAYDIYQSKGRNPKKIMNPVHMEIRNISKNYKDTEKEAILRSLELQNGDKIVSIFCAYYLQLFGKKYQKNLENSLVSLIRAIKQYCSVVVKIHPNEDLGYWNKVFSEVEDRRVKIVHNFDKFKLMAISDFVISSNSYAAVEATLAGSVSVNFIPGVEIIGEEYCESFDRNVVLKCRSLDELVSLIINSSDPIYEYHEDIIRVQKRILGENEGYRLAEDIFDELILCKLSKSIPCGVDNH